MSDSLLSYAGLCKVSLLTGSCVCISLRTMSVWKDKDLPSSEYQHVKKISIHGVKRLMQTNTERVCVQMHAT